MREFLRKRAILYWFVILFLGGIFFVLADVCLDERPLRESMLDALITIVLFSPLCVLVGFLQK